MLFPIHGAFLTLKKITESDSLWHTHWCDWLNLTTKTCR